MRFNLHTTKFIPLNILHSGFSIFTDFHRQKFQNIFITPESYHKPISSHSPFPHPPEATNLLSFSMDLHILVISYKQKSHNMSSFLSLACFQDLSLQGSCYSNSTLFLFMIQWCNIVWIYHVYLAIHLLIVICVTSPSFVYMVFLCVWTYVFSSLGYTFTDGITVSPRKSVINIWGIDSCFPKWLLCFTFLWQQYMRFQFLHLFLNAYCLSYFSHPSETRPRVPHFDFNLNFLNGNNTEHLSMCLLAICMYSLDKCLFTSFGLFILFILNSFKSSLCIPNTSLWSDTGLGNIFFHSVGCLFTFLIYPDFSG